MRLKKLLRKNIEPRCTYCAHGSPLADGERIACRKRGGKRHRSLPFFPLRSAAAHTAQAGGSARALHRCRFFFRRYR